MKYDVIIIGAGPSGIFCAYELIRSNPEMKILMIEKGRAIENRNCPKRTTKKCVGCKPCSITTGFAGAGAFSDGKLSLSPDVGGNLPEILGYEKATELINEADNIYLKFGADEKVYGIEDTAAIEKERQNLRNRMNKAEKGMSINTTVKKPKKELKPKDLSLGDTVQVLSMNLKGTVSSHPDSKGFLFVQMGIIRSKVHISDLELVDEPVINTPGLSRTGAGKIRMSKSTSVSTEINLLGKTVDEAVAELDKYLDDAYLAHLKSVRIVHGKGTGALRKGVHNYLRRQKHVADFHLAEFGEGDAGVTIVEFKK